jgi:uncharacterized Tic20 family protein
MSLLPGLVPANDLPRSNARLELASAIVSLAAPFVAGLLHVIGAIKAYNGEWWNPPMTPQFVR